MRIYVLHALWVILCYYSLDGSPLRGVRPPLGGRTRLIIIIIKVERYGRSRSLKVIEIGTNRKPVRTFLVVFHCKCACYLMVSGIFSGRKAALLATLNAVSSRPCDLLYELCFF